MAGILTQALHLLCAIIYHSLVAAFSFPWHVFRCIVGINCKIEPKMKTATFWEGEVYHVRRKPVVHQFKCVARAWRDCIACIHFRRHADNQAPQWLLSAGWWLWPIWHKLATG